MEARPLSMTQHTTRGQKKIKKSTFFLNIATIQKKFFDKKGFSGHAEYFHILSEFLLISIEQIKYCQKIPWANWPFQKQL